MSILDNRFKMNLLRFFTYLKPALLSAVMLLTALVSCTAPKEKIVLRSIKDVVVDATSEPMLRANAVFYNPNDMRGKLKNADVVISLNGKQVGHIKQDFHMAIPAKAEFTIPIEIKLAMKELGFVDTVFGMLGGKKFEVHYLGSVKVSYRGVPVKVPVDYRDNIKVRF
jgi:LEA14-like dessication related protein